jgi:transposase-like protein
VPANPYRGYRFPEEIISQCIWLYFNFCVSFRDVELMMAFRGVELSYETVRRWCNKFGNPMLISSEVEGQSRATSGISTRCF